MEFFEKETFNEYFVPIIQGYIGITNAEKLSVSLISRRAYSLGGTRYNHRGVNSQGKVANYVETELILETSSLIISNV